MSQSFTPISSLGEFGLIDRMQSRLADIPRSENLIVGIGDDAAVYRAGDTKLHVVTTDVLIEGVHFDRTFIPTSYLGWKAIAVNVSDVVAMNAKPLYATVSAGLPRNFSVEMMDGLYDGMAEACKAYGMELVGGDTSTAHALYLSITVIGEVDEKDVVFRRGANVGDYLCLSGDVGGAYAGLKVLLDQREQLENMGDSYEPDLEAFQYVIRRQLRPKARLDVIEGLKKAGVRPTSMIDVSDGVASEVHHIGLRSGVGATVRVPAVPFDPETRAVADQFMDDVDAYALFGGEDYELLFTVAPEDVQAIDDMEGVSVIGTIEEAAKGVRAYSPDTGLMPLHPAGYQHFDGPPQTDYETFDGEEGPSFDDTEFSGDGA
ncbi:MAG: thiamine-phosphate kinase [Bacteroidetes bacterium]|jgi:thiamine-monophosphate kinase|nr:thiamine-phosphate kinase [Bacteroidota bacterium]